MKELLIIAVGSALVNNVVLSQFLGICPILGVSKKIETAAGMGVDPYYLMDQQAARSPIGCNRLLYQPYLMGERTPHLDPDCRGAFIGLSAMHTKYDMLRAVMEGVTYSQRDSVEVLKAMGVSIDGMLACGGGGY